jgi:hypothetical protein
MRKSNSAPSLLSLVQEGNEDADCDDASFAQELAGFDEGLDWTSIKNQRDDDYKHGSTGLRCVDLNAFSIIEGDSESVSPCLCFSSQLTAGHGTQACRQHGAD